MAFTIPNYTGAIEYPVGSGRYPQAQPDEIDWQILANNAGVGGVSSGCAVTQRGAGANQSVDVASGTTVVNLVESVVSSGNLSATAAHATLPRFDLVTVNSSGTKVYTAGTASQTPVFPAIPATSVVLAAVFRQPNDNVISNAEIVDKRVTVASPTAASGWTTLEKSADAAKTSDAALANDTDLSFAVAANGEYRVRGFIIWTTAGANPDVQYGWAGPTSPTQLWVHRATSNSAGALANIIPDVGTTYPTALNILSTSAMTGATLRFYMIFHNGANAGTLGFQWAQNTSDAAETRIKAGSWIEYARVD